MSGLTDAVRALYGAYRLALFDAKGLDYFDQTVKGFWRSFQIAIAIAPLYVLMLGVQGLTGQVDIPFGQFLTLELSAYTLSWLVFPVVMERLTRTMGCRDKFIPFMIAYNWAMVPQYVLFIGVITLGLLGLFPMEMSQSLTTVLFMWTLIYAGFIVKTTLELPLVTSAGIVFMDLLIGLFLNRAIVG